MAFPVMFHSGGKLVEYLLRDTFTTTLAAGAVNGTAAEPGGTLAVANTRNVVDTAGTKLSIASGRIVIASATGTGDPRIYYGPFTRVAGLTARQILKATSRASAGWATATNPGSGVLTLGLTDVAGVLSITDPFVSYAVFTTGIDYTLWTTLFATGGAIWLQGGAYTNPTLLWVTNALNTTPMYYFPLLTRTVNASEADDVQIKVIPSLATAAMLASVNIANPPTGVNYACNADSLHYLWFALPGSPSNGDKIELRYRYQDVDNYWSAYVIYNGGTSQWDFMLDEVLTAGTTNKLTVANVGAATGIAVVISGNVHDCFVRTSTNTWAKAGAAVTDASLNTAVEVGPWYAVGTVSQLWSFNRTWSL